MLSFKIITMMEDRGWEFSDDDDEEPVKIVGGREVARKGDAQWDHDLAEVKELI